MAQPVEDITSALKNIDSISRELRGEKIKEKVIFFDDKFITQQYRQHHPLMLAPTTTTTWGRF